MRILSILVLSMLAALPAHAAPASEQSVEALLVATKSEANLDFAYGQMERIMRQTSEQTVRQMSRGKAIPPEAQQFLDTTMAKAMQMVREELSWAKLKPQFVQLYVETFTQEEIDGLVAFYASPAGQAFVNKMPQVMQKSFAISQGQMQTLLPRMTAMMEQAAREAKLKSSTPEN